MVSKIVLVALLAFVATAVASPLSFIQGRIAGGNDGNSGDVPYLASLRIDDVHVGSCTLYAGAKCLTSAHLVIEHGKTTVAPGRVSVRVGSVNIYAGGKIVGVSKVSAHEEYGNFINDIAVITLSETLVKGDKIGFIKVATEEPAQDTEIKIAGWGSTEIGGANSYRLQKGTGKTITHQDCEESIGFGYEHVLCVASPAGQGICNGDAGAPAVANDEAYGIASFSIGTCATEFPDVYTNLASYSKWISEQ
ncbi:KLK13 family protein [Megaselia abdita]